MDHVGTGCFDTDHALLAHTRLTPRGAKTNSIQSAAGLARMEFLLARTAQWVQLLLRNRDRRSGAPRNDRKSAQMPHDVA